MTGNRKIKIIFSVIAVLLAGWMIYRAFGRMLPGLISVLKSGNETQIREYLSSESRWDGMVCVFFLQFLQVVTIFFPGWPIQIAAGLIYGGLRAFVITFLGYWLANIAVFVAAGRMRQNINEIKEHSGKKKKGIRLPKKIRESTLINRLKNTHPALAVAIGVLMPGMPNGFIPYVAAGTSIGVRDFSLAVAAGCFFPILMTCLAGHLFVTGHYFTGTVMILCPVILIAVLYQNQYRIIRRLEKRKEERGKDGPDQNRGTEENTKQENE